MRDMFMGAPIPGQSLTKEPKSVPWERPPQYVDPDEVFEKMMDRLLFDDDMAVRLLTLLEDGMPVKSLVEIIIKAGVMEGKFTPDVAVLITKPLAAMLTRMAKEAGIQPVMGVGKKIDPLMMQKAVDAAGDMAEEEPMEEEEEMPKKGFMARRNADV